ncbi:MAG: hypothetical protein A2Z52_01635 [Candidatus Moranbacteria bacterium RBG_19FT_COMBO_42_6]|nr:MAG: hypothetical protein A2Z52_01635 [Candidatus Moranbacteria bacterium RBG_19FT_COMBO_42_6]
MEEVVSRKDEFIQTNSPDGGFLQSEKWRKFQESFGRKTFHVEGENYWANIIEHTLPIVGKYFYIPRGPVISISNFQFPISNQIPKSNYLIKKNISEIIKLAKENNIGWIRFDANNQEALEVIYKAKLFPNQSSALKIKKAPHDMQPRELFIVDISKPEEELLAGMKSKTRYNIRLAQKHGVGTFVSVIPGQSGSQPKGLDSGSSAGATNKYLEEFLRLVKITAQRDKITPHPDVYYRKMFETIPAENIKLYIAEYNGKIIAGNINIFFGKTATYLHGASDHNYKNVMAPYLLQWQVILHAKEAGCVKYDLGGVMTDNQQPTTHNWAGITRFKTGFSATTVPTKFPGSYDIVINPPRYNLYRILQRIKALF